MINFKSKNFFLQLVMIKLFLILYIFLCLLGVNATLFGCTEPIIDPIELNQLYYISVPETCGPTGFIFHDRIHDEPLLARESLDRISISVVTSSFCESVFRQATIEFPSGDKFNLEISSVSSPLVVVGGTKRFRKKVNKGDLNWSRVFRSPPLVMCISDGKDLERVIWDVMDREKAKSLGPGKSNAWEILKQDPCHFSDVEVIHVDEEGNEMHYPSCRLMLASASHYYKTLLSDIGEKFSEKGRIIERGVDKQAFEKFMEYLHSGDISLDECGLKSKCFKDLFYLANVRMVDKLVIILEDVILKNITVKNALPALEVLRMDGHTQRVRVYQAFVLDYLTTAENFTEKYEFELYEAIENIGLDDDILKEFLIKNAKLQNWMMTYLIMRKIDAAPAAELLEIIVAHRRNIPVQSFRNFILSLRREELDILLKFLRVGSDFQQS